MADGHVNKCKDCNKKDVKTHRNKNIEKIRAYDRARGSRQGSNYVKEYRKKYPTKEKAHRMIRNHLRSGKITKPNICEFCNEDKKLVAHHLDYLKPLDVDWICQACHKQWHAVNGPGKNGEI